MDIKIDISGELDEQGYEGEDGDMNPLKGFIRSNQDNKLFVEMQIKNVKDYITDDCYIVIDTDSIPFKAASGVEDDYISVTSSDGTIVEEEFDNKTDFKGGSSKAGVILAGSWLFNENLKREVVGKTKLEISDFEITDCKRLRYNTSTEDCLAMVHKRIDEWIDAIKTQLGVHKVLCVMGEGHNHRNDLLLPNAYKGSRKGRPILLKEARQYVRDTYETLDAREGFEADEVVDGIGYQGYLNYLKTGKFNYIKAALDKDARATPSLLFSYDKAFNFHNPHPWLIHASNKDVGSLQMVKKECKAIGFLQTAYQCLCGDTGDEYGARYRMPAGCKPKGSFGEVAFFTEFSKYTTAKEILEAMVKRYNEFYPRGVKFTAWDGTEVHEDTLWWASTIFACQYMKRSYQDTTTFEDLLKGYKVDYSCLSGNHKPPTADLDDKNIRPTIELLRDRIVDISEVVSAHKKADTKGVLLKTLEDTQTAVKDMSTILAKFFK